MTTCGLHPGEFDEVFPFHLLVDQELRAVQVGRSLRKLLPELEVGVSIADRFTLDRPRAPLAYEVLRERCRTNCVLMAKARPIVLKGQILAREDSTLLFLGSPRVTNASELSELGLMINDFAVHDAIIDFLFLSHAQQSALVEVKAMAARLAEQRLEIREAHNRLSTLYLASRVLAESKSLNAALSALVPSLAQTLGCANASAWLQEGNELVCQIAVPEPRTQPRSLALHHSRGLIAGVFTTNEPVWLPAGHGLVDGIFGDVEGGRRAEAPLEVFDFPTVRYHEVAHRLDRAVCGLPIRRHGKTIGVIALAMPRTIQRADDLLYLLGDVTGKIEQFLDEQLAAEELAAARDTALASVRAKSAFLANVSHEIRTPLGAVLGLASVLRGMRLQSPADQVIDDIHDAGTTLLRLVDDLLDESSIEAGKVSIETRPFELAELVRATVAPLQVKAAAKGVPVIVEIDPQIAGALVGDRVRIGQVIANLVGNALKFTELGTVRVRVHAHDDGPGSLVRIEVADTGIGIDPDQLDRIFDPFTQVDESTTRRFGGAGLGLTISRRLVAMMGGTLDVTSALGKGSTFTVTLRLERAPAADLHLLRVATDAPAPATDRGLHILVVEDNPLGQRTARLMLEQLGHRVDVAEDGTSALLAVERNRYDLVLMDCHLPGIDGFEATRRIRALPGPTGIVPIVACTASVLMEERDRCLAVGMNEVLTKPLSPEALHRVTSGLHAPATSVPAPPVFTDAELLDAGRIAMLRGLADARGRPAFGQMFAAYCEHAPAHLASLEAAASARDPGGLRRAAHALLGMSLNVGASAVARACALVERAAVTGSVTPIDEIRRAYEETLTRLADASAP